MTEPADLSGLDFAVDMMRHPSRDQLEKDYKEVVRERDAYFDFLVSRGYAPDDALQEFMK